MKPCKDCGAPTIPNSSQCVDCHVKRLWGADYHEMVGQYIEAADRAAAERQAQEALPFDGPVDDADYAGEEMYRVGEIEQAS